MNTHLRKLIAELKSNGWHYESTQTNGAPHFAHPLYGRVAIASTPADWEDECNYTRQRIRKAERRRQLDNSPVMVEGVSETTNPLDEIMSEISTLESQLKTIEEKVPEYFAEYHSVLEPIYASLLKSRKELILWLGHELCNPKWKKGQIQDIEDLCLHIAHGAHDDLGVDLIAEIPFLKTLVNNKLTAIDELLFGRSEDQTGPSNAEDWDQWFDQYESASTIHSYRDQSSQTQKKRPSKKAKSQAQSPEHQETEDLSKKLYLGLARELHPDKTTDEQERDQRTHLMKQLNAAYQKKDLRTLMALLHQHGSDQQKQSWNQVSLESLRAPLLEQVKQLKKSIADKLKELPDIGRDWKRLLLQPASWQTLLKQEKRRGENECARWVRMTQALQGPKGLQNFLKTYHPEDWWDLF